MSRTRCVRWKRNARPGPGHGGCFRFFRPPKKQVQHESTRVVLVLCIRVVFFLFCGFRKNKSNIRAPVFLCFFGAAKKTNPIGGHKGCVFPECGAKGSRLTVGVWGPGVCSLAVSACDRVRALWQGRWGTLPNGVWVGGREGREEGGGRMGTKGGIRVPDLSCLLFWGFQKNKSKKANPIRGQKLKGTSAWEKKTEHMPAVRLRFLRFRSLFYILAVRFGSVSQLPVSGRFPVRAVPVRGSVREPSWYYAWFIHASRDPLGMLGPLGCTMAAGQRVPHFSKFRIISMEISDLIHIPAFSLVQRWSVATCRNCRAQPLRSQRALREALDARSWRNELCLDEASKWPPMPNLHLPRLGGRPVLHGILVGMAWVRTPMKLPYDWGNLSFTSYLSGNP